MNFMRVSHMRNFSTCKDAMKQINNEHKLLGKEHVSTILSIERTIRRSTTTLHHRSTSVRNQNPLRPEFGKRAYDRYGTRRFHWEEKDEYGVYRDDQGHARDVDGHIMHAFMDDIRKLMERASRDEHIYICLPEHVSSFTQTKLVPEIYTKDEIYEMFYGKPQTSSRRIDDPGLIVACHCGAEYETDYSATIETHTATSIDSAHQKSIDSPKEESVDSSPGDWENDYYNPTMAAHTRHTMHTEERAIEYKAIVDEEDRLLHHSSWKTNAPSINRNVSTSIDTHLHQTRRKRASTDIAYYPSIGINVDCAREGDYSIGSWVDDHHHESYAVETAIHEPGADELHEGFTYEEFLNMQRRDEAVQHQAETCWERTHFNHPCSRINRPSIDDKPPSSIYIRPKPKSTVSEKSKHDKQYLTHDEFGIFRDPDGYARAIDGHALHISRVDIADIL
ncbi:hypothetical protein F2Q70_00021858 [Brassica cretica]|uniref:Uncharacterized protein n=1 Tax=Brassica cretica TaxID=69181 RepID=A0A8S9GI98_BRACR|nr:hypothetical protein F2Q70_00021858 [Brassica cretica]